MCVCVSVPHRPVYSCDLGVFVVYSFVKCFSSHSVVTCVQFFFYADKTIILVFLWGHVRVCVHACVDYSFS